MLTPAGRHTELLFECFAEVLHEESYGNAACFASRKDAAVNEFAHALYRKAILPAQIIRL